MNNKKLYNHKFVKLAATAVMSVVMFTLSTIPALAYNLPPAVEIDNKNIDVIDTIDVNVLPANTSNTFVSSFPFEDDDLYSFLMNLDFSKSDYICIDENGVITNDIIDPRIIECNHNYLAARVSHHDKNSDGSCSVTYYDAKKCAKCGRIVVMDRLGVMNWDKCPH